MGYDCTLHAVDEKGIIGKFVPALLAGARPPKGFAEEDQELWEQTLKSLVEDSPADAASMICQSALVFASKSQPNHYERGFALCLWPEQPDGLDATFPQELTDSPELLFGKLVEKFPQLRGQFPREFAGNWSTGTFISAKKIPKALQWVEEKVGKYAEGDQRLFRGLRLVLQHCARNKVAYWEGTDLPIAASGMSLEGAEQRRTERSFKWPDYGYKPIARQGCLFVCEYYLGPDEKSRTALADFSLWPPSMQWLPEYVTKAAFSPTGKLVTIAAEPGKYFYTVRLRFSATPQAEVERLGLPNSEAVGENGYDWCGFLGEQVVAILKYQKGKTLKRYPLFQHGDGLVEDKIFRPAKDDHSASTSAWRGSEMIRVAAAKTGDGSEIFIWGESGYELTGEGYEKTFALVEPIVTQIGSSGRWSSVAANQDGFFYVANGRLYEIHRGGVSIPHLPKLTNIMEIRPGPADSLLLREGDNKPGDWGKLYWPKTRDLVRLKPDLLPDVDPSDLLTLYWLEEKRLLLAFTAKEVWFVPWDEIEKLPRIKVT